MLFKTLGSGLLLAAVASAQGTPLPPTHINVEIDYMRAPNGHTHEPSQAVLDALVQMFACQGITLNLFVSDAVPHIDVVQNALPDQDFFSFPGPNSFSQYKTTYGDTAGALGWHYCLIAHAYDLLDGEGTGSSGYGEGSGNDFIVTLGNFNEGAGGTDFQVAATIAHELGHNLGLGHRSPTSVLAYDDDDYAPNYASIMSYQYQLRGVASQMECLGLVSNDHRLKDMDYSYGRMRSLTEASLSEVIGVGIHAVDWDCDGVLDTSPVNQDLDSNRRWCTTGNGVGVLRDYDDWANIVDYTYSPAVVADTTTHKNVPCMNVTDLVDAQAKAFQDPSLCPGSTPTLVTEACIPQTMMAWVDPSAVGVFPDGAANTPYQDLIEAVTNTPSGSVLYLQAGTYANGGSSIVIDTPRVLAGPGGAVVDP